MESGHAATLNSGDAGNARFPDISWTGTTALCKPSRARVRQGPGLLRSALAVRAHDFRPGGRRGRSDRGGVQARLLPARAGSLRRGDGDEAVARLAQEQQATEVARALPGGSRQALLQARHRTPDGAIPARTCVVGRGTRLGDVYLSHEELQTRVRELGRDLQRDYDGREPLLVAPLKASVVFVADLLRALRIPHGLDFLELASYAAGADEGGHARIRLLKDLDSEIAGRHVLIVEDVIDTGLTLNYLCKTLALRAPATLAAVTLLDRPYRRLVDDIPVRYVGFTVPDELFVGYGFDLQERYRNLPDLHVLES